MVELQFSKLLARVRFPYPAQTNLVSSKWCLLYTSSPMTGVLGLQRGSVILVESQEEWSNEFASEKKRLLGYLGRMIVAIQHIGSTSVPGLVAKPIIDILVSVLKDVDFVDVKRILESHGYEYRENGSSEEKMLLVKGPAENRTHYVHVTHEGSRTWQETISFRNVLRSNRTIRKEYGKLKQRLAALYPFDRPAYTAGKESFIEQSIKNASLS